MEEEKNICCFFGHRKITGAEKLKDRLYKIVEDLITHKCVDTFLFGSKSDFDKLCLAVVTELKDKYPHIQRIYVRAEFKHISDEYKAYLLQSYDDTYYPEQISASGRAVYVERNRIMIDRSHICVVYYNENYQPPERKNTMLSCQPKSGTRIAYEYAQRNKRNIIMVAD